LIGGKDIVGKYEQLYNEKITSDLHSNINYRKSLLKKIKDYCQSTNVTMSTCMEFEIIKKKSGIIYESLNNNKQFMTSDNCEGINIPIYTRKKNTDKFKPVKCKGNCLYCRLDPVPCKISELQEAKNWKLKDYRRWSQTLNSKEYKDISSFL